MVGRNRLAVLILAAAVLPAGFAAGAAPRPTVPSGFAENFDAVTAPALPAGWVATNAQGPGPLWVTEAGNPDTVPNAAHVDDSPAVSDKWLDSPPLSIATATALLTFRHSYSFWAECLPDACPKYYTYFDGGVLEISIGGGDFEDILAAGGSFVAGGYTGPISAVGSPIVGRAAWSYGANDYVTTVVKLPTSAAGSLVVLRWRVATAGGAPASFLGWWIDSIEIRDGYPCDAIPLPARLDVDTAGNGVLEPGETVDLDPYYYNNGDASLILTGGFGDFGGPPGTVIHAPGFQRRLRDDFSGRPRRVRLHGRLLCDLARRRGPAAGAALGCAVVGGPLQRRHGELGASRRRSFPTCRRRTRSTPLSRTSFTTG